MQAKVLASIVIITYSPLFDPYKQPNEIRNRQRLATFNSRENQGTESVTITQLVNAISSACTSSLCPTSAGRFQDSGTDQSLSHWPLAVKNGESQVQWHTPVISVL